MSEAPELNVDELRRRARRRLVGAVVLALGAAVIVPMLLESEPKPLGEDVSVRIPPVDDGKFVNRLTDKGGAAKSSASRTEVPRDATSADAPSAPAARNDTAATSVSSAAPRRSLEQAEQKVLAASAPSSAKAGATPILPPQPAVAASDATPPPAPAAPVATAPAVPTKSASTAPASTAPTASAKSASTAPATGTAAQAPAPSPSPSTEAEQGAFSVQLAAYADDKGANSLANKLKRAGYPAYTEPLKTSKGTLWRVRVGPYASRDSAIETRNKLKGEGYSGIVAAK